MKFGELHEKFESFEKEEKLFERKIDGVYFWKRIRHLVYDDIRDEEVYEENSTAGITLKDRIVRLYLLFRNIFIGNPFLSKESDVVVVGQSRRKKIDGEWWDIYSDYLLEDLDYSHTYLDEIYPGTNGHKHPMKTSNVRYLDLLRFTPALLNRLGLINLDVEKEEREKLRELSDSLEDKFDVSIDIEELAVRDLKKRKVKIKLYRKLLKKVDPEIVLLVKATRYTLNEACEQLDIPTVELQHGVIHDYHRGYSYPNVENIDVYSADYLFSWGNFWTKGVNLPFNTERVHCVGFPHFEGRRNKYENSFEEEIIFISQPGHFLELSKEAIKLEKSLPDYSVKFKVHPKNVQWKQKSPELAESEVEVVYDEIPLYEMFSTASYQVGVSSTALFEGLGFGIKTLLYRSEGSDKVEKLGKKSYIEEVSGADQIKEIVESEDDQLTRVNTSDFFHPNPVQNMKQIIEEITEVTD